ncbi:dihydroxyacetone kinase phosphoryl donor subunit DhaM [Arthrobacter sp. H5]|uniref:dihydroxyacetone kinase phosphoryl donor subunit DhaM n=1 Tax=Arthrobacter sp. H5 TaxID=1267973 RepID=UPI000488EF22|nr:dihydroxyacetone kinase phosphoryl donor subunit DhaM [Arthrobacter sp. H5]
MTVGLVIVSHSAKIADGVCELAAQMAPDVPLIAAGGTDDVPPRIGTGFQKVQDALVEAERGSGVVVLTDLGSAVMTAEMALEFLDGDARSAVRIARAALVEGSIAAAVRAQSGGSLDEVVDHAESAIVSIDPGALEPFVSHGAAVPSDGPAPPAAGPSVVGEWDLPNPMGLHARPAAVLARELTDMDVEVSINGVDAKSVMLLMSLGLGQGRKLSASASGPDAQRAIDYIGDKVTGGFGET